MSQSVTPQKTGAVSVIIQPED
jgi:calmodulin